MTQRNIRRVAAAATLVTALVVTAPAQAATGRTTKDESGWMKAAVHWVASLLPANWAKNLIGIDPDGLTTATPTDTNPDRGHGIDPDG